MIKKITINLILVLSSLLVVEIFFAIFFISRPNPTISIIFKPFTNYEDLKFLSRKEHFDYEKKKYKPGKYKTEKIEYQINNGGFRGPNFSIEQIKKNCIGISYGGSTTLGLASIYNHTYPKILEDQLNYKDRNCRVLNAGVSSKSLKYIFSRSINELSLYKPNFITIYNNRNSAMYDATTSPIKTDIVNNELNLKLYKLRFYLENNIMTYKFSKKIFLRLNKNKNGTPHPTDPQRTVRIKYFEDEYFNTVEQIFKLAEKNQTKLILIKQIYYINPKIQKRLSFNSIPKNIELLKKYHKFDFENNVSKDLSNSEKDQNYFMITNVILNQQFDMLKNKHNKIIVLDILDDFYKHKSDEMTYDGLHLKEKGNKKIAKAIADVL